MRAFLCRFGKQDAVIGQDRYQVAVQMGKTTDQRGAEQRFELIEYRAVHQPRNDFAHIKRLFGIGRDDAVQLVLGIQRRQRAAVVQLAQLAPVEVGHTAAGQRQGMLVTVSVMVGNTGHLAVHIGTTQIFSADHFAGGRFYQGWPGQENRRLLAHHNRFVSHGRHIGAACGTRAHNHGDLRNAGRAHVGLIKEDPAKVLAIRKHFILTRQVGAARVHQINARQAVLLGNRLRAQVFLYRQRVVRTAFDRGIVRHNHAFNPFDPTNAGDDSCCGNVFAVHAIGSQLTEFQKGRARVQ